MQARQLALAGIIGPVVYAAAVVIGAPLDDGYSHMHSFVSELAAEGSGARLLMTAGFLVLGLCLLVFAWSVRVLRPAAGALALVIALSGAGTIMAGTFSCDEGCPVKGHVSTHQQLHNVAAIITFSSWIIAPLLAGWQLRGTRLARISIALGLFNLVVALLSSSFSDRQPDDPVGLLEEVLLITVGVWLVLTALELRRAEAPSV
jgi:hypothetical membrane protein